METVKPQDPHTSKVFVSDINAHVEIDWDSKTVKHAKTGGFICKKHNEPLKFFSMDDNSFVCSLCCFERRITSDNAYVCQ